MSHRDDRWDQGDLHEGYGSLPGDPPPVRTPRPAPFPEMTETEEAGFWAAVRVLRAERALAEHADAGVAAVLAASGPVP